MTLWGTSPGTSSSVTSLVIFGSLESFFRVQFYPVGTVAFRLLAPVGFHYRLLVLLHLLAPPQDCLRCGVQESGGKKERKMGDFCTLFAQDFPFRLLLLDLEGFSWSSQHCGAHLRVWSFLHSGQEVLDGKNWLMCLLHLAQIQPASCAHLTCAIGRSLRGLDFIV